MRRRVSGPWWACEAHYLALGRFDSGTRLWAVSAPEKPMHGSSMKDILRAGLDPTPGKHVTDSNRFPGHEARMAAHIHRARTHECERTDGRKCNDCIKGKL